VSDLESLSALGRLVLGLGVLLVVVGLVMLLVGRLVGPGRFLPGDIVVRRPGFTFYFPIVTSILVSLILTLLLFVAAFLFRR